MTTAEKYRTAVPESDRGADSELIRALDEAIEHDELELYYQPQVDIESGVPVALEALVRWPRPGLGTLAPDDFLPAAEAGGLIGPLTAWVVRTAAKQLREWQQCALVTHGFRVAVNVPAAVFADTQVVTLVRAALKTNGLEPGDLVIELTESNRLDGQWGAVAEAMRLRSILGVDLSIDDFGTGWSSIALLHEIGADELKIDRSFVHELHSPTCRTLVEAIVRMARDLGMRVVAEGIETDDQRLLARSLGCDIGQGWLWGKAVPAADVELLLCATAAA